MSRLALLGFLVATGICISSIIGPLPASLGAPVDLDLSSTYRQVPASQAVPQGSVTIMVNGQPRVVSGSDVLTAAEFIALQQILSSGMQSLQIGATGAAVGGSFSLSALLAQTVGNLTVPQQVRMAQDFALIKKLDLTGNLTNMGTLDAFSSDAKVGTAEINALNIFNNSGAVISTANNLGALSSLNLVLNAANSLINNGVISSSGDLSIASPIVMNTGLMSGSATEVRTQILNNMGTIRANSSDLIVTNLTNGSLTVNNFGGVLESVGLTKFELVQLVASEAKKPELKISGGTVLGAAVSFSAPNAELSVELEDLGGDTSIEAGIAHFNVTNGTHPLVISRFEVTGDPDIGSATTPLTVASFTSLSGFNSDGGVVNIRTTEGGISFGGDVTTAPAAGGSAGFVSLDSASFISVKNIDTSANGSGDGGNITLTAQEEIRTGSLLSAGAPGGIAGSKNISTGIGDIEITASSPLVLKAGDSINANGALHITTPSLVNSGNISGIVDVTITSGKNSNNGTITAFSQFGIEGDFFVPGILTMQATTGNMSLTGNGSLEGTSIVLLAPAGSVNAAQGVMDGVVTGSALNNFFLQTQDGSLDVADIAATNGNISISSSDDMTVLDGSSIVAGGNVSIHSDSFLQIGTQGIEGDALGVSIAAGTLRPNFDKFSTNVLAFTDSAFLRRGTITVDADSIGTGDDVSFLSIGGDTNLAALGSIDIGFGNDFFAQGGNIVLQSSSSLNIGGFANITSVGRSTSATVTIGGVSMLDYTGGGLALYAGVPLQDLNGLIRSLALSRKRAGTTVDDGSSNFSGTTFTFSNGHHFEAINATEKITVANSTFLLDGGVVSIDPIEEGPHFLNIGNANITVIGPALSAFGGAGDSSVTVFPEPPIPSAGEDTQPNTTIVTGLPPTDLTRSRGFAITTNILNNSVQRLNTGIPEPADSNATIFVSSLCQPFLYQYAGAILFGCGDTQFKPSAANTMNLGEGRLVAITSDRVLVVQTQNGEVSVDKNSAALIEQSESGAVRIASLYGGSARMRAGTNQKETLSVQPGQELILQSEDDDQELIPTDGVAREPIAGAVQVAGMTARTNSFDRKELAEKELLLNCTRRDAWQTVRDKVDKVRRDMMASTGMNKAQLKVEPSSISGNVVDPADIQPVSFGLRANATPQEAQTYTDPTLMIKHSGDAEFKIERTGEINLQRGEIIVSSAKPARINSDGSSIFMRSGAVALIDRRNAITVVRPISENHFGSVAVLSDDKYVTVPAGCELLLGKENIHITRTLKNDGIARRKVRIYNLTGNMSAAKSEVSFVSLAHDSPILQLLLNSTVRQDQKVCKKLIKTAACLVHTTGSHGQYSIVPKPED
jgi:hypothetical protein